MDTLISTISEPPSFGKRPDRTPISGEMYLWAGIALMVPVILALLGSGRRGR